jgi:hypothetical protein
MCGDGRNPQHEVWFLTPAENKSIRTPYSTIVQFLNLLAKHPYNYLGEKNPGKRFVVE